MARGALVGSGIAGKLAQAEVQLFALEQDIARQGGLASLRLINVQHELRAQVDQLRAKLLNLDAACQDFLTQLLSHPVIGQVGRRFVPLSGVRVENDDRVATAATLGEMVPPEFAILRRNVLGGRTVVEREPLDDLAEAIQTLGQVVVQGPPGSGKTVLLQRHAWEVARAGVARNSPETLPVFLPLGDWPTDTGFQDWAESVIRTEYASALIAEDFPALTAAGRLVFLIDAVNELALLEDPGRLQLLGGFLESLPARVQVVMTCRPWDELPRTMSYQRVEILPLTPARVRALLDGSLGEARAAEVLAKIRGTPLEDLATLPYFARMLAYVVEQEDGVPSSQGALIEKFLSVALAREARGGRTGGLPNKAILQPLAHLAYDAQAELGSGAGMSVNWSTKKLARIGAQAATSLALEPKPLLRLAADANIGIVSMDWTRFRFAHQVLGDWLVGQHLVRLFDAGYDLSPHWRVDLQAPDDGRERLERTWRVAIGPPPKNGWEGPTILGGSTIVDATNFVNEIARLNPILAAGCLIEAGEAVDGTVRASVIAQLIKLAGDQANSVRARVAAGDLLAVLGDPRLVEEPVAVDGTTFLMGGDFPDPHGGACPVHEVSVATFALDVYPVTYQRYGKFIEDGGYARPELWMDQGWQWRVRSGAIAPELWDSREFFGLNRPVVGVNWFEASAFAEWAGGRLPTEAEWELAAGWNLSAARRQLFPWGDSWNPDAANCRDSRELAGRTTPVGIYPSGQSSYGFMDMCGNVWEWTSSAYMPYPYDPDDGREHRDAMVNRVLRGGTFWSSRDFLRCSTRFRNYPLYRFDVAGFRVAYDRP